MRSRDKDRDWAKSFILEFNKDAMRLFGLNMAVSQGLEYDGENMAVIYGAMIMDGGNEVWVRLMGVPQFNCDADDDELLELVAASFHMTNKAAAERLEKAGLL